MKNSWNIYTTDVKNIVTSVIVAIIVGGLILLPSLYAWINIKASWDPYGQTDQIPVAIVNEDKGASVRDNDIHVGDDLVDTLKESDAFEWHFIGRDKAINDLELGDFYAVIVIPEDFSEKLGTVIKEPEKANIEYYVNEKINAIAPKITEKGASVIVDEISSEFISTVNGVIFEMFNDIGIELENELPQINQFEDYVFTLEEKLPEIKSLLDDTSKDADNAVNMIAKAKKVLPQVQDAANQGLQTINNASKVLNEADERFTNLSPKIKEDLSHVLDIITKVDEFMEDIASNQNAFNKGTEIIDETFNEITETTENIDTIIQALEQYEQKDEDENDDKKNSVIKETVDQLNAVKTDLQDFQNNSDKLKEFLNDKQNDLNKVAKNITDASIDDQIDNFIKEYESSIEPTVRNSLNSAHETLNNVKSILTDVNDSLPGIEQLLNDTSVQLVDGKKILEKLIDNYPAASEKIGNVANKIRDFNAETDMDEIIQLLQNDTDAEKGFFAEPIVLNENKVFPIENYGTGMTPFYTVLSIWVGCLLMVSILSTETNPIDNYSSRETYFGRLFTFLTASLLQTVIITSGDLLILGVNAQNPVLFILFGLYISFIFITIVYTLVSVFGDIGKAMVIVMLVLQIAGSGGTYPVALLPEFFQKINPFLPFTYAISLMREAVGGIVWQRAIYDILFLSISAGIAILFGVLLKETINKRSKKVKEKSKESGLFN